MANAARVVAAPGQRPHLDPILSNFVRIFEFIDRWWNDNKSGLISNFRSDSVVTINRVILRDGFTVDDLQERVAELCENVKTYHSDTGSIRGFVALNNGDISNEGSTVGQPVDHDLKEREALVVTFWRSFEQHEAYHRSDTFQPLFHKLLELCEKGNGETAFEMLWSGKAYSSEDAKAVRTAKARYAA